MEIGFALPVSGSWATAQNVAYVARRAEELGYRSLWTFQRLLSPVDDHWGETYRSVADPLVTLAYAAALTQRIRLGVAVLNLPFVTPILLAKQTATLDLLSGGRLEVGLGLGWSDEEYAASGATKHNQGRRAEEFVAVVRQLWTRDVVEHEGEFYRVPAARMRPQPLQSPHPPVLLGGTVPAALRRAGRIADGWVSSSRADLTTIADSVEIVRRAAAEAGRDPGTLRFVCRGAVKVRADAGADRAPLTGTLAQVRHDLDWLAEQGITEVFVDLNFDPQVGSPDADPVESFQRAAEALEALRPGAPSPRP